MRKPSEEKINRILGYSAPVLFVGAMVWGFMMHSWLQPGLKDPLKVTVPEEPAPASSIIEPQGGTQEQAQAGQQPQDAESEEAGAEGESPDNTDKAGSPKVDASNGTSTGNKSGNSTATAPKPKNTGQSAPVIAPPATTSPAETIPEMNAAGGGAEADPLPPFDYEAMYGGQWEAAAREVDSQTQLREDPREATDPATNNVSGDKAGPEKELQFSPPLAESQTQRKYGLSYSPFYQDYRFHGGVDLSAEEGEEVYLTAAGRVTEITYTEEEKYRIVIEHAGGWTTVYSQLDQIYIESGQLLQQDQPIGIIAAPGSTESSAPHLHWELWYNGERMNPMEYLQ